MPRIQTLFAITSVLCAGLGLVCTRFARYLGVALWHRGFSLDTFCYGCAALFCLFAFVYSTGYLPIHRVAAQWHLVLTWAGLILFVIGFASFVTVGSRPPAMAQSGERTGVSLIPALGFFVGPLVFLLGQALFVVSLLVAMARMRRL